ncbi:MAG: hypothetical protein KAT68_10605 [Bacteroidales bacterium]|nr:hypothetical protein [Bacteroidales bacterium]
MKKITFLTLLIISNTLLFGQIDSLKRTKLADLGLYPYPDLTELENITLNEKLISAKPILSEDINNDFTNIEDLKWINSISKENNVITLGEYHYYKYIQNFRNRLFFAINTYDYFPLIVFENQYSITAYVNHYINIEDEVEAKKFFRTEIHEMIQSEETYDFLQHIRRWNKNHPNKKLSIGFSDIEHDYKTTIKKIIIPYFDKIETDTTVDIENLTVIDLGTLLPEFKVKLKRAKEQNLIGNYPFITHLYIGTVIDNLEALYKAYYFEFNYYRQKAIIRNLTDTAFLGKYWLNNKVFIHGGGYHTPTHFEYPDNGNFYREGSYLAYDFSLTKGKTYSIMAKGLALCLGETFEIELDSCLHVGSGYKSILKKYQKVYKRDIIRPQEYLFDNEINSYDSLMVKKAIQINSDAIMINSIDWNNILNETKNKNSKQYLNLKYYYDTYKRYDKHIYVVKSPLTKVRKKKMSE